MEYTEQIFPCTLYTSSLISLTECNTKYPVYCRIQDAGGGKLGLGVGNLRAPILQYKTLLVVISTYCIAGKFGEFGGFVENRQI